MVAWFFIWMKKKKIRIRKWKNAYFHGTYLKIFTEKCYIFNEKHGNIVATAKILKIEISYKILIVHIYNAIFLRSQQTQNKVKFVNKEALTKKIINWKFRMEILIWKNGVFEWVEK